MEFVNSAFDPGDSALAPFLDPQEFQKQLELLSSSERDWGAVGDVRTTVLKCHPGRRCAFQVTLRTGDSSRELIGKVYKKECPNVFEVMTAIRREGFGEDAEFSIPRPLAYLPALRLLLVAKVKGAHAAQIFLEGEAPEREMAARRSAKWLARFHTLKSIPGEVLNSNEVFRRSFKTCKQLAERCPSVEAKGQQLLEGLEPTWKSLLDIPVAPGHGDFVPAHVFLASDKVITVDWDSFILSDPSRDVARFLLGIRRLAERHLGSIRALDSCAEIFLETYLTEGDERVAKNVPFYMAALCLRQAKRFAGRQRPRWQERAEALLDEGLRALAAQ
jgi:Phosphotransferase enzyme family